MISLIRTLFGGKNNELENWIRDGALIVDVRTPGEYKSGHVKSSINMPLDKLNTSMGKLKKDQPIVTCCASGMRSANAQRILNSAGFKAMNGGSWNWVNQLKK
jgi:rhodanese-related sulfurtransferase